MAMDYNDWLHEQEDTFEDNIHDESYEEEPFDESVLTPEQKVELDYLEKEWPTLPRSALAMSLRVELISHRAALEGRDLTFEEIMVANRLEEVIYWVPPRKLEGIFEFNSEIHDYELCHMPSIEDITSSLHTPMIVDECYDLICESQRLDTMRFETLNRNYDGICYDIHDLKLRFSMHDEFSPLLEKSCLGDVLDVDKILSDLENPKVEMDFRSENDVFYMIDGDEVDYFVLNSFKPEVDFIFPSNAFDSHEPLVIKEQFMPYVTHVVSFFDEIDVFLPWATLYFFVHMFYCTNRRRTKGALAQPFDSHD